MEHTDPKPLTTADPSIFASPQRESTVDMVIGKIKELLLSGKLRPGDKLPNEMELTRSLSASRGSIREAMKILSSFGVLEIRRGDGTYVCDSTGQKVFDHLLFQVLLSRIDKAQLVQLRELLEIGITRIVVQSGDEVGLAKIRDAHFMMVERMKNGESDPKVLVDLDIDFHRAIAAATKNVLIERIYGFTLEMFEPLIRKTYTQVPQDLPLELHQKILDSLQSRNADAIGNAIHRSMEEWNKYS